jgi:Rad3-related DNA helicase
MGESFEKIGILASLAAGLSKAGIAIPTGIQMKVIPMSLLGKDIIGQSATGTGKTLAYLLPLFQKIDMSKREMQVIILAHSSGIHQDGLLKSRDAYEIIRLEDVGVESMELILTTRSGRHAFKDAISRIIHGDIVTKASKIYLTNS